MAHDVEFGAFLVTFGDVATPEAFTRLATEAEGAGFDAACVGDHVALPERIPDTYPFSATGESPFDVSQDAYDAFQVLASLAAATDDIALGTNTTIVPYRHPVTLTKHVLSLDNLSGGRFEPGFAPGWMETEFEVLDVPYDERGSRTDEFLEIHDRACAEAEFAYEGPHHAFQRTGFHPRPVDDAGPPVWVGGYSGASFRRLAEHGDGWTIFPEDPESVAAGRERALDAWADHDREGEPEVAVALPDVGVSLDGGAPVGDEDALVDRLGEYVDAGATRVYLFPQILGTTLDDWTAACDYLMEDVVPQV